LRTFDDVRLTLLAALLALTLPSVAPAIAGAGVKRSLVPGLPRPTARPTKVAGLHCPEAGRTIVSVPTGFDGVRVVVANTLPGAAVDITVMVGAADRRVRAWGGGAWSLRMDDAPSGPVLVAIEPSLDAAIGACVERIQLLRDEQVVADVQLD